MSAEIFLLDLQRFSQKVLLALSVLKNFLIRVDGFDWFDILAIRHPKNKTTTETNV
jgi:hypothetical protein